MLGDIFNDVLGPVMFGPSSSHTAAPVRIGNMARKIHGEDLVSVNIKFSTNGSYAGCYKGQGSDRGFAAGLLGFLPHDFDGTNSFEIAKKLGISINFIVNDEDYPHPNTAIIKMYSSSGDCTIIETLSLGGGTILIKNIDGAAVNLNGGKHYLILWYENEISIKNALEVFGINFTTHPFANKEGGICLFATSEALDDKISSKMKKLSSAYKSAIVTPILPIVMLDNVPPFTNATEMLKYIEKEKTTILEAAFDYEQAVSGLAKNEIYNMLLNILDVMTNSVEEGIENSSSKGFVFTKPTAPNANKALIQGKLIPTGILNSATVAAIATMEANRSIKRVVAAPTAGSCGVLPAILYSLKQELSLSDEDCCNALMVAGIAGIFIYNQATFAAEVAGCQAENGAASAMAAAMVSYLYNLSSKQCIMSAALAMQNLLGLICDPVAGSVEVPCVSRNVVAIANAVTSSNMIICGYDPIIPFDECIAAMLETGRLMPPQLRCTGLGGLAATKCASCLLN